MKTAAETEKHLNEVYSDTIPDYCTAFQQFDYLTVKSRGKHTTRQNIIKHYNAGTLGKLLRRYDPIAFNVSKNDF